MCKFVFSILRLKANLRFAFCFFLIAAPLSSSSAFDWRSVEKIAAEKKLHESLHWRRLLHYQCDFFGCESRQDGADFFLSPSGKNDPRAELTATIRAFQTNPERDFKGKFPAQNAVCQFPARLTWLARETGVFSAEPLLAACKEFQEFAAKFEAQKVSLVFSSYYLNNPSSSFGHTLLKIERRHERQARDSSDLLSYGVNYAALPTTTNPVLYAILGMVGGFKGAFAMLPYYYKVREYTDFEARDLWEYKLALTADESDLLIKHIWELGFADFDYFYFTENCSYYMINLLDVAAPRLSLVDSVPFWMIPNDTVKAAADAPGLVQSIHHRPSIATALAQRYEALNEGQKELFFRYAENYEVPDGTDGAVLDALIDRFDMEHAEALTRKEAGASQTKHRLLLQRSRLDEAPRKIAADEAQAPHLAHDSFRGEISFGERGPDGATAQTLHFGLRFALHDLTDPLTAMPRYARLEMMAGDFFYDLDSERLKMDRFRLVGIEALNSWSALWRKPAWRFDLGAERVQDRRCPDCFSGLLGGAVGLSREFHAKGFAVSPFIYANVRLRGGKFENGELSYELGPSAGVRLTTAADFNILIEYERRSVWNTFQQNLDVAGVTAQKTFARSWGVRAQWELSDDWRQWRAGLVWFD